MPHLPYLRFTNERVKHCYLLTSFYYRLWRSTACVRLDKLFDNTIKNSNVFIVPLVMMTLSQFTYAGRRTTLFRQLRIGHGNPNHYGFSNLLIEKELNVLFLCFFVQMATTTVSAPLRQKSWSCFFGIWYAIWKISTIWIYSIPSSS